jgi:uncharacterized damage-inducible protein DinB
VFFLIFTKIQTAMSQNQALIAELQMEAANTRKILNCVPTDKNDWKPHEKSMVLGRLTSHVADLPSWITMTIKTSELDLATMDYKPHISTTTEELVAYFDGKINEAVATLEKSTDEDLDAMWTLRRGDHVMFTLPKKVVIRSMAMSHQYHHRGQLTVYLRLLDVPFPGIYGPSADDMIAMKAAMAAQEN